MNKSELTDSVAKKANISPTVLWECFRVWFLKNS